ncbi:hypothetical protein D3C87_1487360 [compost metagenome]
MREDADRISIAFKVRQIGPLCFADLFLVFQTIAVRKVMRNSSFARVPECRVAEIVRQAGGRNDIADLTDQRQLVVNLMVPGFQIIIKHPPQRFAYTCYF